MVRQLGLWNQPNLNVIRPLKESMAEAAKGCDLSRDEIADQMNDLADRYGIILVKGRGKKLTVATLEKWLNPEEKQYLPSIKALPVFCAVVESKEPLRVLIEPLGFRIIDEKEAALLTWAEHYHTAKGCRAEMRKLEAEL